MSSSGKKPYRTVRNIDILRITDPETGEYAEILCRGAALNYWQVTLEEGGVLPLIHGYTDHVIPEHIPKYYRGAKLSPFPCRINQGRYTFKGKTYQLPVGDDGHALHGLLANVDFDWEETEPGEVVLSYTYDGSEPGYPFPYKIRITYQIKKRRLLVQTDIESLHNEEFPIADGWHPYFLLKKDSVYHTVCKKRLVHNDLIPTGEVVTDRRLVTGSGPGKYRLDDCFLVDTDLNENPAVAYIDYPNGDMLGMMCDAGYPFLQVYDDPSGKSVALEPLSAAPDAFNNDMGTTVLQPGEKKTFGYVLMYFFYSTIQGD